VTDALAAFVDERAFGQVTGDDLRVALGESLGDPTGVGALWRRWFEEVNGAETSVAD
jgi:aminopeptidase N